MEDFAIKAENVSKLFRLPHEKNSSIKSAFINFYRRKKGYELQRALNDVSFEVKKGEFFGIVGRNGSGKSTLLKLLAGIYLPTKGQVHVRGTLTPFIELGVGFNPELTGRENVFLNGALLGFNRKEMQKMYKDIVEFAEIERFMDQKLKNYSSGMQVRLAFSIAIRAESDVLLIDEVLAVGDAAFQQKCYEYFRNLKKKKRTVVFVSHDRSAIENFCDRCILIDNGKVITSGMPSKVLNDYNNITLEQLSAEKRTTHDKGPRWGNRDMEITKVKFIGDKASNKFKPYDPIKFRIEMKANKTIVNPIYGIVIKRGEEAVFTTNTKVEKIATDKVDKNKMAYATYEIENIFGNGRYSISPAIANENATVFLDWQEGVLEFFVSGWDDTFANLHPKHLIEIKKRI
jgi:ABC-2 type transport system ATP-binding protein